MPGFGCLKGTPALSGKRRQFWLQIVNCQLEFVAVMPGPADIERVIGFDLCLAVLDVRTCVYAVALAPTSNGSKRKIFAAVGLFHAAHK